MNLFSNSSENILKNCAVEFESSVFQLHSLYQKIYICKKNKKIISIKNYFEFYILKIIRNIY